VGELEGDIHHQAFLGRGKQVGENGGLSGNWGKYSTLIIIDMILTDSSIQIIC